MTTRGFSAILENVFLAWPEGLIGLDSHFCITAVSPAAESMLGYSETELLGKPIHAILCSSAVDYRHDPSHCPVTALCNEVDPIHQCEAWWVNKSGEFININVSAPFHNQNLDNIEPHSAVSASVDENPSENDKISGKTSKKTTHLLSFNLCPLEGFSAAQSDRLAHFAELNPLPMAELSANCSIEYANPSLVTLMVDPGFDHNGHPLVFPNNLEEIVTQCINEKSVIDSIEKKTNDLVILWTFCPVFDSFPPLVHAYGQDISEIRKTQSQLEEALYKAQVATQTKSQFLANMSHEIRTPLTAIIGYAESIWDGSLSGMSNHDAMGTIIRNGKQMLQIINDILDLSKIEACRLEVEQVKTDLGEILVHIDNVSSLHAQEKFLDFTIEIEYPFPTHITSDPVRIKQVLLNLCSNALKFTHQGSVTIKVSYNRTAEQIEFAVVDTGIGIPEEKAKKLFQAFSQADASTTRHYGGTGLGLFISRQLCEMLGGTLTLDSTVGKGSTFTAKLSTGQPHDDIHFAETYSDLFAKQTTVKIRLFSALMR